MTVSPAWGGQVRLKSVTLLKISQHLCPTPEGDTGPAAAEWSAGEAGARTELLPPQASEQRRSWEEILASANEVGRLPEGGEECLINYWPALRGAAHRLPAASPPRQRQRWEPQPGGQAVRDRTARVSLAAIWSPTPRLMSVTDSLPNCLFGERPSHL